MEGFSRKAKQRPRPEPLFIPPKAGTFIAPPVYSNITPYQSHLRSPVRLADHPSDRNFELPPYTPPPILSPVREGSGLYFNAILSASSNAVPPPITPKSAHRTLLRSSKFLVHFLLLRGWNEKLIGAKENKPFEDYVPKLWPVVAAHKG